MPHRLVRGSPAHTLSSAETENRVRAGARKNCVFLLRGGEGGPRLAFSPAVAGRMRGLSRARSTGANAPRTYSSRHPVDGVVVNTQRARRRCDGRLCADPKADSPPLRGERPTAMSRRVRGLFRLLAPDSCFLTPALDGRCPAAGSCERARMSRTGAKIRASVCVLRSHQMCSVVRIRQFIQRAFGRPAPLLSTWSLRPDRTCSRTLPNPQAGLPQR